MSLTRADVRRLTDLAETGHKAEVDKELRKMSPSLREEALKGILENNFSDMDAGKHVKKYWVDSSCRQVALETAEHGLGSQLMDELYGLSYDYVRQILQDIVARNHLQLENHENVPRLSLVDGANNISLELETPQTKLLRARTPALSWLVKDPTIFAAQNGSGGPYLQIGGVNIEIRNLPPGLNNI